MHINHKSPCSYEYFEHEERRIPHDFFDSVSKAALFDIAWHLANVLTGSGVDSGTPHEVLDTMKKELAILQAQDLANKTAWKPTGDEIARWKV